MCIYKIRVYEACCHRGPPSDLEATATCANGHCEPAAASSTDVVFVPGRCSHCREQSPGPEPSLGDLAGLPSSAGLHDDSGVVMPPTPSPARNGGFETYYYRPRTRATCQEVPGSPRKARGYGLLGISHGILGGEDEEEEGEGEDDIPFPRRILFPVAGRRTGLDLSAQRQFCPRRPPTPETPTPVRFKSLDSYTPTGRNGPTGLSGSCPPGSSPLTGKRRRPFMRS